MTYVGVLKNNQYRVVNELRENSRLVMYHEERERVTLFHSQFIRLTVSHIKDVLKLQIDTIIRIYVIYHNCISKFYYPQRQRHFKEFKIELKMFNFRLLKVTRCNRNVFWTHWTSS